MDYIANLLDEKIRQNYNSVHQRDGVAWDNKKKKTALKVEPRGKCFKRMLEIERVGLFKRAERSLFIKT